ncbi:MAG: hypothetical protein HQL63_08325 [Magnetococcales bacterium]|nr:hypothetical protein [Magnetococcales bacterium]MBF0322429.1 hypothetical protein [Magnetococcales bacterium]
MADYTPPEAKQLRKVLSALPDVPAQESLTPPALSKVYLPKNHGKALSLDASIVSGMRGAGKSFWTAVLSSPEHQALVQQLAGHAWKPGVHVRVGYGLDDTEKWFPSEPTLAAILKKKMDPFVIWQTVVLRHALDVCGMDQPFPQGWHEAIQWCSQETERVGQLLTQCDQELLRQDKPLLVLFDSLDRLASEWPAIRKLLAGALRFCLQCRSRQMIRLKFFLRPDMEEDTEIWEFRDSSKLRSSKVELSWGKADLYGLVFHMIGNSSDFGERFRAINPHSWQNKEGIYFVPDELIRDEHLQKEIVGRIAGPHMGSNSRRGYTYTWIPSHLADAIGRVSPRSILLAFKRAAETMEKYPDYKFALHHEAIQQGVVHASRTRVDEIKEDYPWIKPILEACRNMTVPIDSAEFTKNWKGATLRLVEVEGKKKLPPRRFGFDPIRKGNKEALLDDLIELAVIYRTEGDRINMPDIFRVQFGIKRKGGVKPPR